MSNQTVTIYLNTPLVQPEPEAAKVGQVFRIKGSIQLSEPQGLTVVVKGVGDDRGWLEGRLPFKKIFIPLHKIDFMQIE